MVKKINVIYILGTSYCGSSLLGFLIGSSKKIFDAGELNHFNRNQNKGGEICTCGFNFLKCNFWKPIYKKGHKIYERPSILARVFISLKILFGIKSDRNRLKDKSEYYFFKDILQQSKKKDNQTKYVLDVSKSLWRLIRLLQEENINLKIIYLYRDIEGNVSSFAKHCKGFWNGLFIYKLNNFLINKFLKTNAINYLQINYKKLCENPQKTLDKMGEYLGENYSNYSKKIKYREYHVPSGNYGTRGQFLKKFKGLKYDNSWEKRLNKFQKNILRLFN